MRFATLIICIVVLLFGLAGCESADCDTIFFFKEQDGSCTLVEIVDDMNYDSLLIIPSHFYPSELKSLFSLDYDYNVVTDPYKLILFTQAGKVVKSYKLRCSSYVFEKRILNNGVAVLLPNTCYLQTKKTGYKYVSYPAQWRGATQCPGPGVRREALTVTVHWGLFFAFPHAAAAKNLITTEIPAGDGGWLSGAEAR